MRQLRSALEDAKRQLQEASTQVADALAQRDAVTSQAETAARDAARLLQQLAQQAANSNSSGDGDGDDSGAVHHASPGDHAAGDAAPQPATNAADSAHPGAVRPQVVPIVLHAVGKVHVVQDHEMSSRDRRRYACTFHPSPSQRI